MLHPVAASAAHVNPFTPIITMTRFFHKLGCHTCDLCNVRRDTLTAVNPKYFSPIEREVYDEVPRGFEFVCADCLTDNIAQEREDYQYLKNELSVGGASLSDEKYARLYRATLAVGTLVHLCEDALAENQSQ